MTGTFKANNPYNNFLLVIYALVLKAHLFVNPPPPLVRPSDGILYKYLISFLEPAAAVFSPVFGLLTFALLCSQALLLNRIVNTQRMMLKPNYLTGMAYLLITSLFSDWFSFSAALIVNSIMIWVWSRLCGLYSSKRAKTTIFNLGFAIGIATLIYSPAVNFALLIFAGLAISRPFKLPEWIIAVIGILAPFYFYASWLFLSDRYKDFVWPMLDFRTPIFTKTQLVIVAASLIAVLIFTGAYYIQNNIRRQLIQTRKSWQVLYLYALVAMLVPFINVTQSFSFWILVAVPLAIWGGAGFFYPQKKWIPMVMHLLMFLLAIYLGYFQGLFH